MALDTLLDVILGAAALCFIGASVVALGVGAVYVAVVLPLRFLTTYAITKIRAGRSQD